VDPSADESTAQAASQSTSGPTSRGLRGQLLRSAGSSLAGWALEMTLLTLFVDVGHLHYLVGAGLAASGFITVSWILSRRWAFQVRTRPATQIARHTAVVASSYGLSLPLLWLLKGRLGVQLQIAWMIAGTSVFFLWTFPLHRLFTYRVPAVLPARHEADE
jgi:putative flippase GtrA